MAIDIDSLVAPVSDEQPSGPDLSYESERQQIEAIFDRPIDDGGAEESDTDWREAIRLITGEAAKTRDLWLAVYLMRAAVQSGNFDLLADGTELLARLVEERWADVHPQLDEYGFIGRKSPCESLTRIGDFLGPLGRVPLLEHPRLGRYSGADFDRFQEQGGSADGFGMFRAALEATDPEHLQQVVGKLDAIRNALHRTDVVMTDNAEGDTATNFQPTYDLLDKIRRAVAANLPADAQADTAQPDGDDGWGGSHDTASNTAGQFGGPQPASGPGFSGGINSRDDVIRALDAISTYYTRHEPTSPVPFALRRAREWISLDFLAVLEDIAPGSLDEAKRVLTSGRTIDSGSASSGAASAPDSGSWDNSATGDGWN
jgi:type VI secretion system protein ImpA